MAPFNKRRTNKTTVMRRASLTMRFSCAYVDPYYAPLFQTDYHSETQLTISVEFVTHDDRMFMLHDSNGSGLCRITSASRTLQIIRFVPNNHLE